MADSNAPATCPDGHGDTVKLLSTVAVGTGAASRGPAAGGGGAVAAAVDAAAERPPVARSAAPPGCPGGVWAGRASASWPAPGGGAASGE